MNNNVLVIGADHHNTLGIIESLGQKGIMSYVLIVADVKKSFVLTSKYVVTGWICKKPSDIIDIMIRNFDESNEKTIVFSSYDDVSAVLESNSRKLESRFILPITSIDTPLSTIMSKEYMSSLARKVGLQVPRTWIVTDSIVPEDIEYPCITKAISSIEGTKRNMRICHNRETLESFLKQTEHCPTIQIQKFIMKEFEFQLLGCSLNSGEEVIISGRTHIDRPNGIDNTFFLKFDKLEPWFQDIVSKSIEFVKATKYSGTFSIEYLHDINGCDYFTEMNFRNDGNAICQTAAGVNIPYIYYLYYSNGDYKEELCNSTVRPIYLMPEIYYFKCLTYGEFGLKEWWHNMKRTDCFITYFKGDTKPFWGCIRREISSMLKNKLKRVL